MNALSADFPQAEIRDYGSATILPGLMDAHIHLGYYWTAIFNNGLSITSNYFLSL
jgi:imidazolonepropionase-like amidohydrolase